MKKALSLIAMLFISFNAQAVVLTFDDITVSSEANLNGAAGPNYGGLNWSNTWGVLNTTNSTYTNSGYANANTSGNNIAFNSFAQTVSVSTGTFDWNGAFFTGAWNDGLVVRAIGYSGATVLYDMTLVVNTTGPTWFNANMLGIDSLEISSSGGSPNPDYVNTGAGEHFAMDDFTFNMNIDVPEASALIMLGLGLMGMGVARRRKA